ncbi:MAG TPA: endonuclease domain-containing protein, partial [Polyangia bacterium]
MDIALARRRALRGRATDAERLLWRLLRMRQFLGLKFRRQHPLGRYIVDFYCAERRLAVELDGGQHFTVEGQAYDRRRTAYLAALGIRVVRFTSVLKLRSARRVRLGSRRPELAI